MALLSLFTATGLVLFCVIMATSLTAADESGASASATPPSVPAAAKADYGTVIYTGNKAGATQYNIEIDFFAGGVIRMRARATNTDRPPFQVTDVVVGKRLPGPRLADIEPEERVSAAPPGTYYCGTGTTGAGQKVEVCHVTAPCGTTSMYIAMPTGGDEFKVEFQYKHKSRGVLAQGNVLPRAEGPVGEIVFPQAAALYGIPERAVDLALKAGGSYRLFNLDVFKYQLDSQSGIYGSIPFLMAHGASGTSTTGLLWLNAGDTRVETKVNGEGNTAENPQQGWYSKWSSEHGLPDLFFFPGPTPRDVQRQHAAVVGPTQLPPLFALGYHQCRWNYRSQDDSLEVDHGFDVHDIPYDVLWLDIEHTDGKRYFTWDKNNFPNPTEMINKIASHGRKMVTISDPHIKVDPNYYVHKEASAKGLYVKREGGKGDFEGHCWPGTSSWVDFYNSAARDWYSGLYHYDRYEHSTPDLYTWIDMNEMSVFESPEVTMPKSCVHRSVDGVEVPHGAVHNMYGFYHHMATYNGHIKRNSVAPYKPKRPFVLTRSFFSGSQRYGAMWTGDNMARWDHLEKSLPMLLTLSISNFPFVGADVGGFFDNPDAQLMTRWYQAAVFYPFFRGHAHLETKRREPWLFGDDTTRRIRDAIVLRYALLPYIYTQFFLAHDTGDTLIQPLFYNFPAAPLTEQRAYTVGPALLSCPVTKENAQTHEVPLPAGANWYEFPSGKAATAGTIDVTIDTIPAYLRGGHIMPTRQRTRRSTAATVNDPLTLYVAVAADGVTASKGLFYLDDGDSFDYQASGQFLLQEYTFDPQARRLTARPVAKTPGTGRAAAPEYAAQKGHIVVERVVILGLAGADKLAGKITATRNAPQKQDMSLEYDPANNVLLINQPTLPVNEEWSIAIE